MVPHRQLAPYALGRAKPPARGAGSPLRARWWPTGAVRRRLAGAVNRHKQSAFFGVCLRKTDGPVRHFSGNGAPHAFTGRLGQRWFAPAGPSAAHAVPGIKTGLLFSGSSIAMLYFLLHLNRRLQLHYAAVKLILFIPIQSHFHEEI